MNPEAWLREPNTRKNDPALSRDADTDAARAHVREVLSELSTMMMVTHDADAPDALHARPMSVAKVGDDGTLFFLTSVRTHKVDEARATTTGLCTGQTKTRYASVRGTFTISADRDLIASIWNKGAEVWFDGKDDPDVRAIVFRPIEAEVWDLSGAKGLGYLASMVTSLITGEPPTPKEGVHEKVVR